MNTRTSLPGRPRAVALAACVAAAFLALAEPAHAGDVRLHVVELANVASTAASVNDLGQVVGWQLDASGETSRAVLWQNGGTIWLTQGQGPLWSQARAINNAGQIAGMVGNLDNVWTARGATWAANTWQLSMLPDSGHAMPSTTVSGINDSGLIVGQTRTASGIAHAVAWRDGQMIDLGSQGIQADNYSAAYGVNRWGQITGTGLPTAGGAGHTPLIWTPGAGNTFTVTGSWQGLALNDIGQVTGVQAIGDAANHRLVPILMQGDTVTRMLPGDAEGYFTALNNATQAIGQDGFQNAMVWSPSGGGVVLNDRLAGGSVPVRYLTSINQLGQMTAVTANDRAALITPTGTLDWQGSGTGWFNDAARWDSGLGLSPNRFLDARITGNGTERNALGVADELLVKSLLIGTGTGTSRLILLEGGRISTLQGARVVDGGRLAMASLTDAIFATGRIGGTLQVQAGGGLEFRASRPDDVNYDRLVVAGLLQLDGGTFFLDMTGAPPVQLGDSYDFLDWETLAGHFDALSLPVLPEGLAWDTSRLYVDGVLSVQAVPEPASWALWLGGVGLWAGRHLRGRGNPH